jgi:hypothetical protein
MVPECTGSPSHGCINASLSLKAGFLKPKVMSRKEVPIKLSRKWDLEKNCWYYYVYFNNVAQLITKDRTEAETLYALLERGYDPTAEEILAENVALVLPQPSDYEKPIPAVKPEDDIPQ